jgi:hypothetical protein
MIAGHDDIAQIETPSRAGIMEVALRERLALSRAAAARKETAA